MIAQAVKSVRFNCNRLFLLLCTEPNTDHIFGFALVFSFTAFRLRPDINTLWIVCWVTLFGSPTYYMYLVFYLIFPLSFPYRHIVRSITNLEEYWIEMYLLVNVPRVFVSGVFRFACCFR
jgi:hypothetical protein